MIDILIPVLNRPENAVRVMASIEMETTVDHSVVFLCSKGDKAQIAACKHTGARVITADFGERHQYPKKMNHGFSKTDREFVLLAADDLEFQPGWDVQALEVAKGGWGVIGTDDCANPHVQRGEYSTHPLVSRRYVMEEGASADGPGILCHEGYDHNYTDLEISMLAQKRGRWAFAALSRICHRHPGFEPDAKKDATYVKGFRFWRKDQQLYKKRAKTFA